MLPWSNRSVSLWVGIVILLGGLVLGWFGLALVAPQPEQYETALAPLCVKEHSSSDDDDIASLRRSFELNISQVRQSLESKYTTDITELLTTLKKRQDELDALSRQQETLTPGAPDSHPLQIGQLQDELASLRQQIAYGHPNTAKDLGCWYDGGSRLLGEKLRFSDDMTPKLCVRLATMARYKFAGVEFGRECWAAQLFDQNKAIKATDNNVQCNIACTGARNITCGGMHAIHVFELDIATFAPAALSSAVAHEIDMENQNMCVSESASVRGYPIQYCHFKNALLTYDKRDVKEEHERGFTIYRNGSTIVVPTSSSDSFASIIEQNKGFIKVGWSHVPFWFPLMTSSSNDPQPKCLAHKKTAILLAYEKDLPDNYYHAWTVTYLPLFLLMESMHRSDLSGVTVVVVYKNIRKRSAFHKSILLEIFGASELIYWDDAIEKDSERMSLHAGWCFSSMYTLAGHWWYQEKFYLETREAYTQRLARWLFSRVGEQGDWNWAYLIGTPRVLIEPRTGYYREILNVDEIETVVRDVFQQDYPQLTIERYVGGNPKEQALAYARSNLIIASHGASMTNLWFAPPGAVVIEVFSDVLLKEPVLRFCYRNLAVDAQLTYMSTPANLSAIAPKQQFYIDLSELRLRLLSAKLFFSQFGSHTVLQNVFAKYKLVT